MAGEKLTSILIMNLSISDLLVGIAVMPLAVTQIATNGIWLFGRTVCRIWVSLVSVLPLLPSCLSLSRH